MPNKKNQNNIKASYKLLKILSQRNYNWLRSTPEPNTEPKANEEVSFNLTFQQKKQIYTSNQLTNKTSLGKLTNAC